MTQEMTTATAAYRAAEVYEQFFVPGIFRFWTPLLLQRALPKAGERVLDVACGTGVVARSAVPLVGPRGKVVGLDINPAMLAAACSQYADNCHDVEWRQGRAEDLPFPDGDFDLVTCQQGLQFLNDRARAVREMRRVLRPGGRAAIAVWQSIEHNPAYGKIYDALSSIFDIPVNSIATSYSFGDSDQLRDLMAGAGFGEVKVESVGQAAHFADPDRFVELTIKGAAAAVPAFAELDGESQSELHQKVVARIADHIRAHTSGGILTLPLHANIATGIS